MKWILFLIFQTGAAPVTPEHHFTATMEFEDRIVCEALLERFKTFPRYRVDGYCLPTSKTALQPDVRRRIEEKFPPAEERK